MNELNKLHPVFFDNQYIARVFAGVAELKGCISDTKSRGPRDTEYLDQKHRSRSRKKGVVLPIDQAGKRPGAIIEVLSSLLRPACSACSPQLLLLHVYSIINEVIAVKFQELSGVALHGLANHAYCLSHTLHAPSLSTLTCACTNVVDPRGAYDA